ncbi:FG-GAP-like repeat-containing protein [Streptomyces sp. H27-D2]|uniref:FG-GAP-like repeat-containing protein n=1 Tax=Streptomyces sp. H27-D2 TaxID=3046304 RepID=UPI002DBE4277|nr:FG-GAP-like repeat-containing protein [Streptomyces sp. H27-D2]MEC4015284.1 FG-GAP-like repeat-containing protein [Streptomyces sp. H27-D2]
MRRSSMVTVARCAAIAALLTAPAVLATPAGAADSAPEASAARTTGTTRAAVPAGLAPKADFNKDGYADVAVSAPSGTVGGKARAGYVTVVYGSAGGADTGKHQVLSQATAGVPGDPAADAAFGSRTVARDLDGDGFTDLATQTSPVTAVTVLWGSADGLTGGASLPEAPGTNGRGNLVGGDFDGDGHADLIANSTTSEAWGDLRVLYGPFSRTGAAARSAELPTDRTFAASDLVAGDMTGDGKDDFVSFHDFEEMSEASIFWQGTADGPVRKQTVTDAVAGAIGDADKDGKSDLAAGAPGEDGTYKDSGAAWLLRGAVGGLSTTGVVSYGPAALGAPELNAALGNAIAK